MTGPTQLPPLHTRVAPLGFEVDYVADLQPRKKGWFVYYIHAPQADSFERGPFGDEQEAREAAWQWALERECERLSVSAQQHRLPILCYSDHPLHGWANEQDGVGIDLGDQEWLIATDRQAWICVVDDWFCHSLEDLVSISHIEMQDDAAVSKWAHPEDRTMFLTLILMNIERK